MRIQLYLTPPASDTASNALASSSLATASAPAPLTALTPRGEMILIELQGSLEMDSGEMSSADGGHVVGHLEWGEGREVSLRARCERERRGVRFYCVAWNEGGEGYEDCPVSRTRRVATHLRDSPHSVNPLALKRLHCVGGVPTRY